jgi:uncharacterized protein YggE
MCHAVGQSSRLALALLLAAGLQMAADAPSAAAQVVPGSSPGIVVTGIGVATAPATAAAIQLIVGPENYGMMPGTTIPDEDVLPIVDAIVASGVAASDVEVINPGSNSMFTGPGGGGSVTLRFEVENPTDESIDELVQSLYEAAADANLAIQHIGARFLADDCEGLQQEASDAAVADARARAERLAASLGAELGALVQAMDGNLFYTGSADSCAPVPADGFGPYGPGVDAALDPSLPVEATVRAQITLTFEMIGGDGATPAST